jgi:hypothetical protein
MPQVFDHGLNAKVPGQSLTMAPGSLPMEKPPLLTDPKQAAEYFWSKLHVPKQIVKLVILLRRGVPAEYIANTLLYTAIIHGIIHINTAMLIGRILIKQIAAIGHLKGVPNMKIKNPDTEMLNFVSQFPDQNYDTKNRAPQNPNQKKSPIKSGILAS